MPSLSGNSWDADLVAVEVVDLLAVFAVFGCPIADLRQRLVGVLVGVEIGIPAVELGDQLVNAEVGRGNLVEDV